MSDESQLQQVTRKGDGASLAPSSRSSLVARGRQDAALLGARCNKCGERAELVFVGRVCASCSEALDGQWAASSQTDWVLVARQPADDGWYGVSVATRLAVIKILESDEINRGVETTEPQPIQKATSSAETPAPPARAKRFWPPLNWLNAPSPDAELGLPNGFCRYLYRNSTFADVKLLWASSDPATGLVIGKALPTETAEILGKYLLRTGVTRKQAETLLGTNPAQGEQWWDAARECPDIRLVRPANSEEIDTHGALLRDQQRHEHAARILKNWGFDTAGNPLRGPMDDEEWKHRGLRAWDEIRQNFAALGLLPGSIFDYEEELRATL